ncbi:MAG: conserved hypothetical protein [uncultured Aureispira sp.]|uniref:Short chain amide porin n=1 Tax=uncultured Aureispira sp. TaxID=1331704 RepID=A0A6S6U533_9BACT|nr:MAG: conserved hypothetical protein [uncultured Aureispira sp.]
MIKIIYFIAFLYLVALAENIQAQGSPDYSGGFKIKLKDDGSKYIRIISWAQIQVNTTLPSSVLNTNTQVAFNLRRARVLMFSQITDKFLILVHFGQNSLNASTMSPTGKGAGSQLFFHDVWAQYSLHKNHTIGAGLHYFNGISRLNNQSTLNMMTMDNNRQSWATIGLTDQFARHLGLFGKGSFGQFQYRLAVNNAANNGLDARDPVLNSDEAVYGGSRLINDISANFTYAGYFEYQLFEKESNFLPYKVGTYMGSKKLLNIGAGFFLHPNGAVQLTDTLGGYQGELVNIFAVDVFFETPLGETNSALTAYGTFQLNNYGKNYKYSAYGSGYMAYGHVGYLFASAKKVRFQPYVSFATNGYDAVQDNMNVLGAGLNCYLSGHNSKLTLEYKHQSQGTIQSNLISLQAMIYL